MGRPGLESGLTLRLKLDLRSTWLLNRLGEKGQLTFEAKKLGPNMQFLQVRPNDHD